ncbi:aerolysin [Paenibacillus sp. J31TS4]|nr:aerolysin [Paenibacillus sp. J31TS4]
MERDLIRSLQEELLPGTTETRHILRLQSDDDYRRCLALLEELAPPSSGGPFLQPLPSIHGFACSLRSPEKTRHRLPFLEIEEDDRPVQIHGLPTVPLRPSAQPLKVRDQHIPWGVRKIKAPSVWKRSAGQEVKIGVIDTGIDYMHPDLQGTVAGGINIVHRHMLPRDDNGHGTHIAGTIAAHSRQAGLLGVAPEASLYAVKAFDHNGTAYIADIVYAIEWCIRQRMDIINMSFGMKTSSKALEQAIQQAIDAGILVVASSGNDGKKGKLDYPAKLPDVLAVGATTKQKRVAPFSNRSKRIDLYAPGEAIYSSWMNGGYHELSGTSMATSHVTGAIALLLSARPRMSGPAIRELLRQTATPIGRKKPASVDTGELNALTAFRSLYSS